MDRLILLTTPRNRKISRNLCVVSLHVWHPLSSPVNVCTGVSGRPVYVCGSHYFHLWMCVHCTGVSGRPVYVCGRLHLWMCVHCTGGPVVITIQLWCRTAMARSWWTVLLTSRGRPPIWTRRHVAAAGRRGRRLHGWRPGRNVHWPGGCRQFWPSNGWLAAAADRRAAVATVPVPTTTSTRAVLWHPPRGGQATTTDQVAAVHRAGLTGWQTAFLPSVKSLRWNTNTQRNMYFPSSASSPVI